jgi:Flp pilus assembly pilin Flp
MKSFLTLGRRLLADEKAAEVTELGIVLALIVALSIAAIKGIGTVIAAAYGTVNTALGG